MLGSSWNEAETGGRAVEQAPSSLRKW